jgi:hypothetical protein
MDHIGVEAFVCVGHDDGNAALNGIALDGGEPQPVVVVARQSVKKEDKGNVIDALFGDNHVEADIACEDSGTVITVKNSHGRFGPFFKLFAERGGKRSGPSFFFCVHKGFLIASVPFGQHAHVLKLRMLAAALEALFPDIDTLFDGVTAGGDEGGALSGPQSGAFLFGVELVHAVGETVKQIFHGSGAVPGVDGGGEDYQIAVQYGLCNFFHIILLAAAEDRPVFLAAAAGGAGVEIFVIQPDQFTGVATRLHLVHEGLQKLKCISVFAGTSHQNANFHIFLRSKGIAAIEFNVVPVYWMGWENASKTEAFTRKGFGFAREGAYLLSLRAFFWLTRTFCS